MFGGKVGLPELLVVLVIALIIFGPSKISQLGKGLGEGIRNFKSAVKDDHTPPDLSAPFQLYSAQVNRSVPRARSSIAHTRATGSPTTLK